eukprot:gene4100-8155_t
MLSTAGSDGTRLMITKMVLENFKSYAEVQEIGPFHKRFSSIVGPNGSGKSNVIDALLFVFGKRAKQLRLNKVSELIHKSAAFPSLEYARVEVYFQRIIDDEDSNDDFTVVEGSQFIVARTAFQNNQSKYTVDGRNTTYTDVGVLLRQHGVDLDNNRFLILQGEVEQIAMMKPKAQTVHDEGLLEYLEDIIGSNKFVKDIDEASKKVEELNEVRGEQLKRLKQSEKVREKWREPRDAAESFLTKEREIRCKQNLLYQINIYSAKRKIKDASDKLEKYNAKLVTEKANLQERVVQLQEIQKTYQMVSDKHDKLVQDFTHKTQVYNECQRREAQVTQDKDHNEKQLKKFLTSVEAERRKEEEALADGETAQKQVTETEAEIVSLEASKAEEEARLEVLMEGLNEASKELRMQLEEKQKQLAVSNRGVAAISTRKEQQEAALLLLRDRTRVASCAVQTAEDKLTRLPVEIVALDAKVKDICTRRSEVETELESRKTEAQTLSKQDTDLQQRLRKATEASEEAKTALQRSKGRSSVLSAILQGCKKGGPLAGAGVRGRMGDLASIDPKYDVAISAATGMLDTIVVDTVGGAEACMEFLRTNNVGRANFIALEKLGDYKNRFSARFEAVDGALRLVDLIQTDSPDILPAFYRALGDTLVASDLTNATKIAYKGDRAVHRVVTLDGNLIETSGTMTGGGAARPGAAAGMRAAVKGEAEVSVEECARREEAEGRLKVELEQTRQQKVSVEKRIEELKSIIRTLSSEQENVSMALSRLQQQQKDLIAQMVELRAAAVPTAEESAQANDLEAQIAATTAEIEAKAPDLSSLTVQVKELQRAIKDTGGPKIKALRTAIETLSTSLNNVQKQHADAEVRIKESKKQATKASTARTKAEKELTKVEEKLVLLNASKIEVEQQTKTLLEAQFAAKAMAEEHENELKETMETYNKKQVETEEVQKTVEALHTHIIEANKCIKADTADMNVFSERLEAVRAKHVSEAKEWGLDNDNDNDGVEGVDADNHTSADGSVVDENDRDNGLGDRMDVMQQEQEQDPDQIITDDYCRKEKWRCMHDYSDNQLKDEVNGLNIENLNRSINIAEEERRKLQTGVDMRALLEFRERDMECRLHESELGVITSNRDTQRTLYEELRRKRLEEFMTGFGVITLKLKEMYQMITLGGDAELELVDSLDPFSEGIVFSVRPPKKSWKNISNLSGGEKTLSSLALVFALHHYKPTPLYVMDEIDAALDFKNVSIVANYIKERTKNAQFIIISLRNNMFELADRLVGIYKTHDATKSVTINPRMFAEAVAGGKTEATSLSPSNPPRLVLGDATNTYGSTPA